MAKLKADFLSDESCAIRINETIIRIEYELTSNKCINESYNTFVDCLINEMDIAGLTAGHQSQRSKSAKSLYKPYWNDLLQTMWDSASEKEKLWLKCDKNTNLKRQLKQEYCNARDVFDKHLHKAKRRYQMKLQDDLLNDLEKPNSRDFWKQIGKIGISNERQNTIPFEVLGEDGDIITDKKDVLG